MRRISAFGRALLNRARGIGRRAASASSARTSGS